MRGGGVGGENNYIRTDFLFLNERVGANSLLYLPEKLILAHI